MSTQINSAAETLKEILNQIAIPQKTVATNTGIPSPHLSGLKKGTRRFTPIHDLKLSHYFGQSEGFWLRLQIRADIRKTKQKNS